MTPRCSRCSECKKSFLPSPRLKARQKTCGEKACQLKHRARYRRRYRCADPESEKEYRNKVKANRPPGFWGKYRRDHVESTERNRLNSKLRRRLKRAGLQRQLDIAQVTEPSGYFDHFCEFATTHQSLLEECRATSAVQERDQAP